MLHYYKIIQEIMHIYKLLDLLLTNHKKLLISIFILISKSMNNFQKFNSPPYYPNLKVPNSFQSLVDYIIESDEVHRLSH